MHNEGESVHVSEEEASGGSKEGVVRWILIFGTILAIGALTIIWVTGAATNNTTADETYVSESRKMQAEEGDSADTLIAPGDSGAQEEVIDGQPVITNPDDGEAEASQETTQ